VGEGDGGDSEPPEDPAHGHVAQRSTARGDGRGQHRSPVEA
jgi:hypothetical protein